MPSRRVIMIQQGARRNYIYARQLEDAGLLRCLISDAAWSEDGPGLWMRLALRFWPRLRGPLMRRSVARVPRSRIHPSFLPNITNFAKHFLHQERVFAISDEALAISSRMRGLQGADIVVNYHGSGGSFLSYAKRQGAKVVTDFVITPKYLEIEQAERKIWPGWESDVTSQSVINFYRKRMTRLVSLSDLYLCPSEAVAQDLAELPGFDPSRVRILPYGISGVRLHDVNSVPGRVLFAGAAGLRKGIPYLARAAMLLRAIRPEIEVVVAGAVSPSIRDRWETRHLTFLGKLDPDGMAREFARADLFCLPSLAEGSATSIFEALAHGIPIVTTSCSGSIIRNGSEGIIVRERDSEAIANAILTIVGDRNLRASMSTEAFVTASRFDDASCGQAFLNVIKEVTLPHPPRSRHGF